MNAPPDLDTLLLALREAKVPVGVRETLRLRQILAAGPQVDREGLKALLGCVLARTKAEREALDRVFEAWFDSARAAADEDVAGAERRGRAGTGRAREEVEPRAPLVAEQRQSFRWWYWLGLGGVAAIGIALAIHSSEGTSATSTATSTGAASGSASAPVPVSASVSASVSAPIPVPESSSSAAPLPPVLSSAAPVLPRPIPDTRTFRTLVPVIKVTPPNYLPSLLALAGALLAVGGALGLWLRQRRLAWLPEPEAITVREGPSVLPVSPAALPGQVLLDEEARDRLVWGIGKQLSDELSRLVDVKRTVRATAAAGGMPEIHMLHRGAYRSVWLWLDEAAEDPTLPRIAVEIEAALVQAGLPVERATYWGVPDLLYGADGVRLAAGELEERQGTAAVALLTDGRILSVRYAAADRKRKIDALLRALGHWPGLGFADFGEGKHGLDRIAGKYEIPVIRPEGLVAFLTGEAALGEAAPEGDVQAWAAASALSPRPVEEATAWKLRRELALIVTPWALRGLLREGRIGWTQEERASLLDWLRGVDARVGAVDGRPVPPETMLGRALRFWKDEEDARFASAGAEWAGTRAEWVAKIERATLDLWDAPDAAARALYDLAGGEDGKAVVAQRLSGFTALGLPRRRNGEVLVVLPWEWARRSDDVRVMLQELGFGGALAEEKRERLRRPGRLAMGLGLLVGLSLGALIGAGKKWPVGDSPLSCVGDPKNECWCGFESSGRKLRVLGGTTFYPEMDVTIEIPEEAFVSCREGDAPCEVKIAGTDAVFLRCGKHGEPKRKDQTRKAKRSVVWIMAAPGDEPARNLAERLIDTGSAEEVILSEKELPPQSYHIDHVTTKGQLTPRLSEWDAGYQAVVIQPRSQGSLKGDGRVHAIGSLGSYAQVPGADLEALAAALGSSRMAPIGEAWPQAGAIRGDVQVGYACPEGMVYIPAGSFLMGSTDDDKDAYLDEQPQHSVTLRAFCMDKMEVTVEQYRQCEERERDGTKCAPAPTTANYIGYSNADVNFWSKLCNGGKSDRNKHPINCVDWNQAKTYCRWTGGRLPSEAEWEYAARGNDARRYPWGSDPPGPTLLNACGAECKAMAAGLGRTFGTMYDGDDGFGSTAPVGSFPLGASPFGLFDMAGNVWEWTEDEYKRYSEEESMAAKKISMRVLRGGSWVGLRASSMRAADRSGSDASSRRGGDGGFRCAREPSR